MASPHRTTVTVDGTKFDAVSTSVRFSTEKDKSGVPQMGSLATSIRVWADFHDDQNLPFSSMKKLFDLANVVTRDKIRSIKIEYWKDDSHQDALVTYAFNGWIRRFETSNPLDFVQTGGTSTDMENMVSGISQDVNHLLVLDIEPALNQQNFQSIQVSN